MEKIDYKKVYKELYSQSSTKISILDIPEFNYLAIEGKGDPNISTDYQQAVEALYSLSYTMKFMVKKSELNTDYSVMPLEGLWWTDNMKDFSVHNKDIWKWKMMIMQPEIITKGHVDKTIDEVTKKKSLPALSKVRFITYKEGTVAQILHIGPYSEEGPTIEKLHQFIFDNGYELTGLHHEIYLSDPRKAAPEKLKTIIRQPIRKK